MTTRLTNEYLIWERGGSPPSGFPFTAKVSVNYPTQTLTYHPGFWQVNTIGKFTMADLNLDNKILFCSFVINKFYISIDDEVGLDSISLNLYSVCVPDEKPKDLCIYSAGL